MKKNLKLQKIVDETAEKMWENEQIFKVTSNEDETIIIINWISYGTVITVREYKFDDGEKMWEWYVDDQLQEIDIVDEFNFIDGDTIEEYVHNLICQMSHTF